MNELCTQPKNRRVAVALSALCCRVGSDFYNNVCFSAPYCPWQGVCWSAGVCGSPHHLPVTVLKKKSEDTGLEKSWWCIPLHQSYLTALADLLSKSSLIWSDFGGTMGPCGHCNVSSTLMDAEVWCWLWIYSTYRWWCTGDLLTTSPSGWSRTASDLCFHQSWLNIQSLKEPRLCH